MTSRRAFLLGLGAALAAPAIIRTPGLLMPVRKVVAPQMEYLDLGNGAGLEYGVELNEATLLQAMARLWMPVVSRRYPEQMRAATDRISGDLLRSMLTADAI
jgi:hypothetical protein